MFARCFCELNVCLDEYELFARPRVASHYKKRKQRLEREEKERQERLEREETERQESLEREEKEQQERPEEKERQERLEEKKLAQQQLEKDKLLCSNNESIKLVQYISDSCTKTFRACELARANLSSFQKSMKKKYDKML